MTTATQKTAQISIDEFGRTIVSAPGTSRVGIITTEKDSFYMVPAVNHGETVCRGGRSFRTHVGAVKAAGRFVVASL